MGDFRLSRQPDIAQTGAAEIDYFDGSL